MTKVAHKDQMKLQLLHNKGLIMDYEWIEVTTWMCSVCICLTADLITAATKVGTKTMGLLFSCFLTKTTVCLVELWYEKH